ncbi:MAG: hypothetical protein J6T96_10955 [Bacteroidales bacterium]|nr:hypothetical protein [Bacteroidales bacterium]MBO7463100.1 hypothetical protein [Bacteroidales bacterium]MBO7567313.1 hypothetical protein [Bacteroidales bacterium]MBP5681737.1 hypothetical protein [Bacteroidales bacterium]
MKKIYSLVAALVVAMVVLASCGASSAYQAQLDAAKNAIEAKDANTAFAKVDEILAGDKLTADDAVISTLYTLQAYAVAAEKAGGPQALALNDNLDLCKKVVAAYNKAKTFPEADVNKANAAIQLVAGYDVMNTAAGYTQSVATLEQAIQAAQQAAAEEEAEDAEEEE